MTARTRFNTVVLLGLAFWVLIAHNLYSFRLRTVFAAGPTGHILDALPMNPVLAGTALAAMLLGLATLVWVANRRLLDDHMQGPNWHRVLTIAIAAGFVLAGDIALWRAPGYPLPQEWSGVLAAFVGMSLVLVAFVRTRRRLLLGHGVIMGLAVCVVVAPSLVPGHKKKIRRFRECVTSAHESVARGELPGAAGLPALVQKQSRAYRLDDRIGEAVFAREGELLFEPPRVAYVEIDDEVRRVLLVPAPSSIVYRVDIGNDQPRLIFGVSARGQNTRTTFEVLIGDPNGDDTVFSRTVGSVPVWQDVEIDLSPWAGRYVSVTLRTLSDKPSLAVWSNPVVIARPTLPNVVVVNLDGVRADHLGVYGYSRDTSPVFDDLSHMGTLYESAYANAATHPAATASLLAGRVLTAAEQPAGPLVWATLPTLPEVLRVMGYATAAFTASTDIDVRFGTHKGFSHLFGASRIAREAAMRDIDAEMLMGDLMQEWIRQHADRSFFLYVHTTDARGPFDPPEDSRFFFERAVTSGSPLRRDADYDPEWLRQPTRESRVALYDDEVAYGDFYLRRLRDMLEGAGVFHNTVFVVTSGSGTYLGEHDRYGGGPPAFVQGSHVPLLIMGPQFPGGRRVSEPVQLVDIAPTILDGALGLPDILRGFEGSSVLPLALGRGNESFAKRIVFVAGGRTGEATFYCGSLHYIPEKNILFDLSKDPAEAVYLNEFIFDFRPKSRARELATEYDRARAALRERLADRVGLSAGLDPSVHDELDAIGYIE